MATNLIVVSQLDETWIPFHLILKAPVSIFGAEEDSAVCIALLSDGRHHVSFRFEVEKVLEFHMSGDWIRYGSLYFFKDSFTVKVTAKDFMTERIETMIKTGNSPVLKNLDLPKKAD